MNWKRFGKSLLLPPMALLLVLLPFATCSLVYAMIVLDETSILRIGSYVLAFYTLTIWCVRIPRIVQFWKGFSQENPLARRWLSDPQLRMNVTLSGNVLWNGAYAALQLGLGWYHRSFWFGFLGVYYLSLALMRLTLVQYGLRHPLGQDPEAELRRYRGCGWVFLFVNLALSVRILFMIRESRLVAHSEITTITMAAYTFTSLTMAIVNVIKYRKYHSPVLSASKAISLASALVSLLSLEGTMLVSFGSSDMTVRTQRLFLAISGGGISIFIVAMAGYMIQTASKQMKARKMQYGAQGNL